MILSCFNTTLQEEILSLLWIRFIVFLTMKLSFDELALQALYIMEESQDNLFLTGKAGTGKSTLLRSFIANSKKNIAVLAPTGVAALNIGGSTIHSFFKINPKSTEKSIKKEAKMFVGDPMFTELDAIVIDEISMVRADLFDYINLYLQIVCENKLPFGGKQMILIGDLFQLPPVVTSEERVFFRSKYSSPYFFSSKVITNGDFSFTFHELEHIYRQKDQFFIDILNTIREDLCDQDTLDQLNERVVTKEEFSLKPGDMYLAGKNSTVDEINQKMLEKLEEESELFPAIVKGAMSPSYFPTEEKLVLKIWAQVMFVVNDSQGRWANGTLGMVKDIQGENISVELFDGETVEVKPYTWRVSQYVYDYDKQKLDSEVVGSFSQIPLKLAWACTIHKSQGKTFDTVVLDLRGGSFAHGQTYVALSRCKSIQWLKLTTKILLQDVILDAAVVEFMKQYKGKIFETPLEWTPIFDQISHAIEQEKKISIRYRGKDGKLSKRIISPKEIKKLRYQGEIFLGLLAFCHKSKQDKVFKIKNIVEYLS